MSNAYPNPFNPITILTYDIPSEMNVSLGIYDVRGRLVEELINGMREQGRYEVTWNADQHSSGVYMIKMTAARTVKVQKVMLSEIKSIKVNKLIKRVLGISGPFLFIGR